ncbi:MAG: DUF2207 domain-containing protein, partial [Bacteroidales bacterium]|nr:DUF2207 domain-containing protein [Bacteroidales bacterium]
MKLFRSAVAGLLLAILPCIGARAQKPAINDLQIEVYLKADGSADVIQFWDVTIDSSDEGTEWYVPVNSLNDLGMSILDLAVVEDGKSFISEGYKWVSKGRSRAEKAGRCGICFYGDGSFDMCWGFGTTGDHKWAVSYTITNLIQSLDDADGFIYQFVNDELPSDPKHVRITFIDSAGTAEWKPTENVGAWTFGYDCENSFSGNTFTSDSDGRVKYVNVMMRFDKGMYSPARSRDITFEQMQKKAKKGSDYGKKGGGDGFSNFMGWVEMFFDYGWVVVSVVLIFLFGVYNAIRRKIIKATGKRWKQDIFGESKIEGWWREAPLGKDICAAYSLLRRGDKLASDEKYDDGIIGAYFLKWIEEGILRVVAEDPTAKKQRVNLALTDKTPSGDSSTELSLYNMVVEAAGENRILEKDEFKKWSRAHYTTVCNWPSTALGAGIPLWSAASQEDRKHLVQLKNFLQDFTLMNEREAGQVMLWKDYLVYAQLFGIADKVTENFKKLYPVEFKQFTEDMGMSAYSLLYTVNTTSSYASLMMSSAQTRRSEVQAAQYRSSGGGGR